MLSRIAPRSTSRRGPVTPDSVPQTEIAGYGHEQLVNAANVIKAGADQGLNVRDQTIGVMTAMGESSLRNIDYGDWETGGVTNPDGTRTTSIGLFQQQDGWGTREERLDPYISSTKFFQAMVAKVPDRESLEPTIVAHRTQVNADPYHYTQFWGHSTPPELGVSDGYIITLTSESVRDVLATAISSVASDEPIDRTLTAIAMAGRALPLDGVGTLLLDESAASTEEDRFRVFGDWPIDPALVNAYGTPWRQCLVQNEDQDVFDVLLGEVDARTGAEMAMAKLRSAWVRPIRDADGHAVGVYIVWRLTCTAISPNQEQHIGDAVRLAHLALEQDRHRRELEFAAHRDALTGVGNRASLNDRIALGGPPSSVLFIDLDRFKAVNDTFGHAVGDEVIAKVGRRIAEVVRRGDEVYRTGGDEFIVVGDPTLVNEDGLFVLAERLIERLAAPFDCSEHRVRIGATIGMASGSPHPEVTRSLSDTILAADRAMYVAKDRGRGCVHHADLQH